MSGQPGAGEGFKLDAIAVLGAYWAAPRSTGGRGMLIGTLNMVGVDPYVQTGVKGKIILPATYIRRERRK